ncbi:hypothetical protein RCL1_007913 [Eukaryota sp. TZLM3-RCL]
MSYLFPTIPDDKLSILVISDIHGSRKVLESLPSFLEHRPVDFAIVAGDVLDLEHSFDPALLPKFDSQLADYLSVISSLTSLVFYILGNHDPLNSRMPKSTNVLRQCCHKSDIRITPGLRITGLNGSIPSVLESTGNLIYTGNPYNSDYEYSKDLSQITQIIGESSDKYILLTHTGPHGIKTTYHHNTNKGHVFMGSQSLEKVLKERDQSFLINIHGHTHDGQGLVDLGGVPVLNPGAAVDGHVAILNLKKNDEWEIEGVEFLSIM